MLVRHKTSLLLGAVAAVVMTAPAHAAPEPSFTLSGFDGAFAENNWTFSNTSTSGSGSITSDTLTITSGTSAGTTSFSFDTSSLLATYPTLTGGTISFNWSWTSTGFGAFDPSYYFVDSSLTQLGFSDLSSGSGSSSFSFPISSTSPLVGFSIISGSTAGANPVATLSITNFTFQGGPIPIPGPLPVLAAAAALGWSSVLRRRIRAAKGMHSL